MRSLIFLAAAAVAAAAGEAPAPAPADRLREEAREIFGILEPVAGERLAAAEVELGRALFWDGRISADGRTSCASCHGRDDWGSDRRRFSMDARGRPTSRHSQTVFNSMGQRSLRWLGDRGSGAEQAERSLTGSMGFGEAGEVVAVLRAHGYEAGFRKAWPGEADPVTPSHYGRALEAYQETLVTPAPFDRFLAGEADALSEQGRAGLRIFVDRGCADCHDGPLLGGRKLRKFGVEKEYWLATGSEKRDPGLFGVTGKEEDRDKFRVAMLRNIGKTGPYFHDGSVGGLGEAVQVMAEVQGGERLPEAEAVAVVAFLASLTGEVPAHYGPAEEGASAGAGSEGR